MQAELIAAATCSDEAKWFHSVLTSSPTIFGPCQNIPIFVDNESALSIANHPKTTPRSKFIDIREFRIRDYQMAGYVRPLWIPTKLNIADGFTEGLGRIMFEEFTRLLGLSGSYSVETEGKEETMVVHNIVTQVPPIGCTHWAFPPGYPLPQDGGGN